MFTLALDIFLIVLCLALSGIGIVGLASHKGGMRFPLSPKVCQHFLTAGAFIGAWFIVRPTP